MTKKEARQWFKEKRQALSEEDFQALNQMVVKNLFEHFEWKDLTIATFLSIKDKKELQTDNINRQLLLDNKVVASISNFENSSMQFYLYDLQTTIINNKWGIPEPINAPAIDHKSIDIVLTPLLGFDNDGNRVGYGKGFYDRLAQTLKPEALYVG